MQWDKIRDPLLASVVLGAAVLTWRCDDDGQEVHSKSAFNDEKIRPSPPAQAPQPLMVSETTDRSTGIIRSGVVEPQANILAADDLVQKWDEMGGTERMQYLEGRFNNALAAIEAGQQPIAKHAFVAESVLTSMRAELYGNAPGRARHRGYENRLDRALGEPAPLHEPGLK